MEHSNAFVPGTTEAGSCPPTLVWEPQTPTGWPCTALSPFRPCSILNLNWSLKDGWMLGSPPTWSSSQEKPQGQPSKSINKLISKYCCLLSWAGTPRHSAFQNQQQTVIEHAGKQAPLWMGFPMPVPASR